VSYRKKHIKPHLKRLKPKKPFFKKPFFWVCLFFILILTLVYFLLFSWFQVSKINISGNNRVSSQDIENVTLSNINKKLFSLGSISFHSDSMLLLNKKSLLSSIMGAFPDIGEIIINRKLPDSVDISVTERSQYAVFCNENNECFSIDDNGVIFANFSNDAKSYLVLQKSTDSQALHLGQVMIDNNIIDEIKKVNQDLRENFQIGVDKVIVSDYLQFKTSEGWSAYFDPSSDLKLQISEMNMLLKGEIPEEKRKSLEYIYLQYKDRAYYK